MIVYFFPYELDTEYDRPSLKRPLRMLNAFKEMTVYGDVIEAIGKSRDLMLHQAQKYIKSDLSNKVDLVYVESINKPLFLQRIFERKINIFGDYYFFWQCKKHHIPLVIFYRDARWAKQRFRTVVPKHLFYFLKLAFYIEFKLFEYLFDVFFLPSLEMSKVLPFGKGKVSISELPPAADFEDYKLIEEVRLRKNNEVVLFYVGNINPSSYNISSMISVVKDKNLVKLNICCRKNDWDQFNEYYNLNQIKNIQVYHFEGEKLATLYRESDIHLMYYEEDEYRKFAVPYKLYESLQYGMPIITNSGTKAASLVHDMDVGWVVNNQEEVSELITRLNSDNLMILEKKKNIRRVIKDNLWKSRAEKVVDICKK